MGYQFFVAKKGNVRLPVRTAQEKAKLNKDLRLLGPGATFIGLLMTQARPLMERDRAIGAR